MLLIGSTCLQDNASGSDIYNNVSEIVNGVVKTEDKDWRILNVLHRVASQVGALDVGYKGGLGDLSNTKLLYLLGAVSITVQPYTIIISIIGQWTSEEGRPTTRLLYSLSR